MKKILLLLALALIVCLAVYGTISLTSVADAGGKKNDQPALAPVTTTAAETKSVSVVAKAAPVVVKTTAAKKVTIAKKAVKAKKISSVTWTASGLRAVGSLRSFDYSTTIRNAYMAKIAAYAKARGIKQITAAVVNSAHQ